MKVLGAHIRIQAGRYAAGFAVVEGTKLLQTESFPAPAERDEAGQLADLHRTALDLVGQVQPDLVAIRGNEGQGASLRTAQHAEGVVMAAVGQAGVGTVRLVTQSLWKPAGLARSAGSAAAIDALGRQLDQAPDGPAEVAAAAAAARAAIVRGR